MNFSGSRLFQSLYYPIHGRPPYDGIVDQEDSFSFYNRLQYTEFHLNGIFPLFICGFDKTPADVVVFVKDRSQRDS